MDFQQMLKDAGVSAVRKLISLLTGIITIPILTRLLGEGAYGIWATALSFVGLVVTVSGLHLHGALIRYLNENGSKEQTFVDILALVAIIATVVTVLTTTGGVLYDRYIGFDTDVLRQLLLPVAILIGGRLFRGLLFNYLRAQQRVKHYEALSIIKLVLEMVAIVAAVWLTRNLAAALWGLVGVTILLDLVLITVLFPRILRWPKPEHFRRYLAYGVPMVPKELSGSLLHHADKFLVLFFLGPVATGIYAVTYAVANFLASVPGMFNSTLYPRVTTAWKNGEVDELTVFYNTFLRWYVVLMLPAIAGLTVLAPSILRFISTPTIATQGGFMVPILAIGFGMQGLEFSLSYPLAAAERTKRIALITLVAVVVNIGLNVALIPTLGIVGAAVATTIAFGLRTGWLYYEVTRVIDLSFPQSGLLKSGTATAAMAAILYFLPVRPGLVQLLTYPLLGVVVFGALFVTFGGVTDREATRIKEWTRRKKGL